MLGVTLPWRASSLPSADCISVRIIQRASEWLGGNREGLSDHPSFCCQHSQRSIDLRRPDIAGLPSIWSALSNTRARCRRLKPWARCASTQAGCSARWDVSYLGGVARPIICGCSPRFRRSIRSLSLLCWSMPSKEPRAACCGGSVQTSSSPTGMAFSLVAPLLRGVDQRGAVGTGQAPPPGATSLGSP